MSEENYKISTLFITKPIYSMMVDETLDNSSILVNISLVISFRLIST